MRNPLNRRLPRELRSDFGKYLVIFLFLGGMIALVSGFLVANDSMSAAYDESFEKYNIEDGNFELYSEADDALKEELADEATLYENFYVEEETDEVDSTLRIFKNRTKFDLACVMDGELPDTADEIAIDRMYADNNELKTGDTLTVGGKEFTISGLVALSDYSALFSNNSDLMFDAVKFGVAVVTEEGFDEFGDIHLHYSYSWFYKDAPADDTEAKEKSEDLLEKIMQTGVQPAAFIPQYLNQAIHFTGDDIVGDNAMITVFLYMVIVIIAFVIAITTTNTVAREAAVIGTLRASGYKRGELVRHYLAMPLIIMLLAAAAGNILGYTLLKDYMAGMYYGSYSLPTYVTRWNADAFVKTTIVPFIIMGMINLLILVKKMQLSPLRFIRRDLNVRQRKKAFKLNTRIPIFSRFRLRVIFQNFPNYFMIAVGVFFANLILLFGMMFGPLLDKYSEDITANMIADYQYILKTPVEVENQDAEKYCAGTLVTTDDKFKTEDVTIYGVEEDSSYISAEIREDEIYISDAYADKYGLDIGDEITLKEKYTDKTYDFAVDGIYSYPSSIALFMDLDTYREIFDKEDGYFNGYFSNEKLDEIDEKLIAATITEDDLSKTCRQLKLSMGQMMYIFKVFGLVMFVLIIYLLSKIIIEKNTVSISMTKILGYTDREINRLYIKSTTLVVVLSILVTLPLSNLVIGEFCTAIFADYPGYFPYYVPCITFVQMGLLGIAAYAFVAALQMHRIKKIPKSEALKNVE